MHVPNIDAFTRRDPNLQGEVSGVGWFGHLDPQNGSGMVGRSQRPGENFKFQEFPANFMFWAGGSTPTRGGVGVDFFDNFREKKFRFSKIWWAGLGPERIPSGDGGLLRQFMFFKT